MSALLQVSGLTAHYGDFQALFGVDLTLDEGETVAIIGANGAGKTTLMRAITGVARITGGSVTLDGEPSAPAGAKVILTRGIAMVPEGRRLFPSLTVEENLLIGAHARKGNGYWTLDRLDLFPILKDRRHSPGTALSGGQQQMVAIGRALMSTRAFCCATRSAGPGAGGDPRHLCRLPADQGQRHLSCRGGTGHRPGAAGGRPRHCMMEGRITLSGRPAELSRDAIHDAYFGVSHA
jgi:branched-chain amino acid transport system ATP-binding protein